MASAAVRPCPYPHCHALVPGGGRCAQHQRPTAHARGYTTGWAAYARAWLVRYPWCGQRLDGGLYVEHSRCAQRQQRKRAQVVDHIESLARGGAAFDPRNHQSLCTACNTKKGG